MKIVRSIVKRWHRVFGGGPSGAVSNSSASDAQLFDLLRAAERILASGPPIETIHSFNSRARDEWVKAQAATIPAGSRVLDVGAGTCPYRALFAHCDYKTHDFMGYDGFRDATETRYGPQGQYGAIDYVADITDLPIADEAFDVVLCTEVLEHVPEPIAAVREMARVLRPGGTMLLTAPLMSGLHQEPHHYYSGFTPHWYRRFCGDAGLDVVDVTPNGNFFKLLAQECARVSWTINDHAALHGPNRQAVEILFGRLLPAYLYSLDDKCPIEELTVGYHVVARKRARQ